MMLTLPVIKAYRLVSRLGVPKVLLGILLVFGVQSASARWYMSVKNYLQPHSNVRLFLGYQTLGESEKEFEVRIDFRVAGQPQVFLHKELRISMQGSDTIFVNLSLPPGTYEVDAEVKDQRLNFYEYLQLESPLRIRIPGSIRISSIYLTPEGQDRSTFERPMLEPKLSFDQSTLRYSMQIASTYYDVLSVRAVLYEEVEEVPAGGPTAYTSLQQANRVVNLSGGGPVVFSDTLNLVDLPGGEYMIQVLVYQGDEFKLDEKIWFVKGGDIKQRIFSDLDNSIRMMRYLVPSGRLEDILQAEDSVVKQSEFLKIWEQLYGAESETEMENYFFKVYQAIDLFTEGETPGWLTDRGRVFIEYGPARISEVEIRGSLYERWIYPRWALSFLFQPNEQEYTLVR